MIITGIDNIDKIKWAEFVRQHPDGNIFQDPLFIEVLRAGSLYEPVVLASVDEEGEINGVLAGNIQREKGIKSYFSRRCIVMGGPLVKGNDPKILEEILCHFIEFTCRKAIYTQFRNYFDMSWGMPVLELAGFRFTEHLNIHIRLDLPDQEFNAMIHKSRHRNYRRAINKGVTFREAYSDENMDVLYQLVSNTYRRVRLPVAEKKLFIKAGELLREPGMIKIFLAESEGRAIAVRFILAYKDKLYDWYAGSDDSQWNKYPNDFLIYCILNRGRENGYRTFDFGGAGCPGKSYGVRDHKEKFGGEFVHFGRYQAIHRPVLYLIAGMGFTIYRILRPFENTD